MVVGVNEPPFPVPAFEYAKSNEPTTDDCDKDCSACDRAFDKNITDSIDQTSLLVGTVRPYDVQFACLTGRIDWPHTIEEEENSSAQRLGNALRNCSEEPNVRDKVVLSNISMRASHRTREQTGTEIMVLSPAFCMLSNISDTASAMSSIVQQFAVSANENLNPSGSTATEYHQRELRCKAVVLICSHMRRDARCGKTAPLLYEEFEEQLRERDLMYDEEENESEEGRVLLTCVSHIGGHKFAGNVLIYRKDDTGKLMAVWYGRVVAHSVARLVEETILNGRVVSPLLRGGVLW